MIEMIKALIAKFNTSVTVNTNGISPRWKKEKIFDWHGNCIDPDCRRMVKNWNTMMKGGKQWKERMIEG